MFNQQRVPDAEPSLAELLGLSDEETAALFGDFFGGNQYRTGTSSLPKSAEARKDAPVGPITARLKRYGTAPKSGSGSGGSGGTEVRGASGEVSRTSRTAPKVLPQDEEARMLRTLLTAGFSKNAAARLLGGSKTTAYNRINRALGEGS